MVRGSGQSWNGAVGPTLERDPLPLRRLRKIWVKAWRPLPGSCRALAGQAAFGKVYFRSLRHAWSPTSRGGGETASCRVREGGPRILRPLNGMILQGARLTYIHIQHEHTFFSQVLWAHFIRKYLNSSALPARYSWTPINLNG